MSKASDDAKRMARENVVRGKRGGGHVESPQTHKENGLKLTAKVLKETFGKKR